MNQFLKSFFSLGLLAGLTISFSPIQAQPDFRPGYVVRLQGDTLHGFINYSHLEICEFRENRRSAVKLYKPQEIKGYGFINSRFYESFSSSATKLPESVFLELVQSGKLSLYAYEHYFFVKKDTLIRLDKGEQKRVEIGNRAFVQEGKSYIGILNLLTSDCMLENLSKVRYTQREISDVIEKYNACSGSEVFIPKNSLPWISPRLSLASGFNNSLLSLPGYPAGMLNPAKYAIYGLGLSVNSPRLNEKIAIVASGLFTSSIYQGLYTSKEGSITSNKDIIINSSFLKIPFGVKYSLLSELATPYIKGGISVSAFSRTFSKTIEEKMLTNGDVQTYLEKSKVESFYLTGYWVSVGYERRILRKLSVFAEGYFEKATVFKIVNFAEDSNVTNFGLLVGITY
ncbi:hypothetical protein [uncultured Imperialibacter sp.]|uniref:hypothetical protein n=1 Tax=uncultured Imperialibacter sp. TaxID=1672639 RepID=UPI0030D91CE4|tara:strand:- start:6122 stop:7318 length:1197 start_codon:yes stop_codon:yes gene_type:complete